MFNQLFETTICKLNSIDSATAASWVQAFGSIAALAVAIFISNSQSKNQIKREDQATKQEIFNKYSLAVSLGGGIAQKLTTLQSWANSSDAAMHALNVDLLHSEIKSMHADLISIDLNNVYPFDVINKISKFKTFSTIALDVVTDIYVKVSSSSDWTLFAIDSLDKFYPQFIEFMHESADFEKSLKVELDIQ